MFTNQPHMHFPETDVARAAADWKDDRITLLDVREPAEWAEAHIPGAVHIPMGELATRIAEVPQDKPIVTVCRSGLRSLDVLPVLDAYGIEDAVSLAGGILAWAEAGHPLTR